MLLLDLRMMESDAEPTTQPRSQPGIGSCVGENDRYRLEQALGKGGMGEVFLAIDTRLNKQVALKLLSPALIDSEAARQRFQQECAICAALESSHIVQVSDYGITAGYPFYVMEYLQGETLSQLLSRAQRLSVEQAGRIVTQICAGLQVAHRGVSLWDQQSQIPRLIKVIHRDLKPDNIFLVPTALGEMVKIIDFGIAKIRNLQADAETTHSLLGTSHYAAPEQFEAEELDERTDLYSLGMILYEMLTGTDPYGLDSKHRSISNTAWLTAHLTKPALSLRAQTGCEALPLALETVVLRCLAKSRQERFASVDDLSQALGTVIRESSLNPVSAHSADAHPQGSQIDQYKILRFSLLTLLTAAASLMSWSYFHISARRPFASLPEQPKAASFSLVRTILGHQVAVWALAIAEDNRLVSGDEAGAIKIWDMQTGLLQRTLIGQTTVRALSLSADGNLLASGGNNIRIWNMSAGTLRQTYAQPVWSLALSQDGKMLVSGSDDRLIRLWDLNKSGQFRTLSGHTGSVYGIAISPDQKTIVSGSGDRTIKVWDAKSGATVYTLSGHQDAVRSVDISADARLVASGSWDKTVKIWNLETKTLLHTLTGHQDRVVAVAFSEDGRLLASASIDQTIKIWDVQTGKLLHNLAGHTNWVLSVEMSRDGQAVSGSKDQTIKIWR